MASQSLCHLPVVLALQGTVQRPSSDAVDVSSTFPVAPTRHADRAAKFGSVYMVAYNPLPHPLVPTCRLRQPMAERGLAVRYVPNVALRWLFLHAFYVSDARIAPFHVATDASVIACLKEDIPV